MKQLQIYGCCFILVSSASNEVRVVLLGKTGTGKSLLGNTLLGREAFLVECSFSSVTFRCQWAPTFRNGHTLQVTDTPGVCDTDRQEDEILKEVGKSIAVASPGPHVVLMVFRCGRFTDEEYTAYVTLKKLFGKNITKFIIVVFTEANALGGDSIDARHEALRTVLSNAPPRVQEILQDAGGRYFAVDNVAARPAREEQAQQLLDRMLDLIAENKGAYFSNKLCEDVNSCVEVLIQRRAEEEQVAPEMVTTRTRQAIVNEQEKPSFYRELQKVCMAAVLPVIKEFITGAGHHVCAAALSRLAACSVM